MDIPQFKDVLQKLSVFKRHSSLMVPVMIGLVGALLFVPSQLMSGKLKAQISDQSITQRGRQVTSLRKNTPASDQWKLERERQQAYKTDANQISLLAKELTQRQLLSDNIFPVPKDSSISLFKDFGKDFRIAIDELLKAVRAGECPTEAELKRSLGALSSRTGRSGRLTQRALSGAGTEIKDALCRSKAESASVYINPFNLNGYEFWDEYQYAGTPEAVQDCWYYQLAYWIIEDVIDTIETMNSTSNNVFTSPVKRLRGIWFTTGEPTTRRVVRTAVTGRTLRPSSRTAKDMPRYVLTIHDGLAVPLTGHVCNSDIDVVHFAVRVIVNTKAVLGFMQDLCSAKEHFVLESNGQIQSPRSAKHNQITILESKIKSIDREDEIHNLYRYGEDAIVELDLICEYVFSTKGYDGIKPLSVKQSQVLPTNPMGWDSTSSSGRRPVTR
ncbi:MAG: hypothetical protein ACYS32_09235 [Planctomycetota bacterium]|jgi:hypothetical protein